MYKLLKVTSLTLLVLFTFSIQYNFAQTKKKKPKSLRENERKLKHSRDSLLQSISKTDTSINSLIQRLEQYKTTFNQINNSLADGLDTADESQQLPIFVKRIGKIQSLANTKKSSTLRYLFILRDNLDRMQDDLEGWQSDLDDVNTKLVQNQHDILKFTNDSLLKIIPADSVLKYTYLTQLKTVKGLWHKTDSANRSNLYKVNFLQNKVTSAYSNILDATDQIDTKIKRFATRAESGEFGYIWENNTQYGDINTALNGTMRLNKIQLGFFVNNETATHLIALLFLVLVAIWIGYNRIRAAGQSEHPETIQEHINFIYANPIVSVILIATAIAPYFYGHPPVIFLETFFLISLVCTLLLVKRSCPKSLFNFLLLLFIVVVVYSLSNLLVQITNFDRLLILLLSIISIVIAIWFYRKVDKAPEGHIPNTRLVLKLFIALQFLSLILNLTGRFSLAKILGVTAVFNLWMALSLYFIIQIIIQGIFLQFHTKKTENTFVTWIDYNILQKKFKNTLNIFATLLWLFYLLQNLNIDDWVRDNATDLLNQSRTIGGASFTFGGFVIFIIVIWLSSLLSKMISYFYDISAQHANDISALKKKNRASTLLIRIGVFTGGFLLAVAASGFPLDKLTVILSAFGVGIGFGLQNVTNNLVSGMILAFEKPIQIGDIIEVDSKSGTVKEIGIRSSKLTTSEGAEVIIPNADMISHHVTNWTMSSTSRRIEILISVVYGSDIEKVKTSLTEMLSKRDDIMTNPVPSVFVNNITDKSVDFRILVWTADLSTSNTVKSHILADIYNIFNKEDIKTPAK
jgi:potassium efflux system protein